MFKYMTKYMTRIKDKVKAKLLSILKRWADHIFVCLTLALMPNTSKGQTYNHDEMVMNQFTVQETGVGSLKPPAWYTTMHSSYYRSAAGKNKQLLRTHMALQLESERKYAEKIDSAMVERGDIEAVNLGDRMTDVAWQAERRKIETKMSVFKSNIEKITLCGGSAHDYDNWLDQYNCIQCGLNALQRGYLPNSERQKEYLRAYKDIRDKNQQLVTLLLKWQSLKDMRNRHVNAQTPSKAHVSDIALEARGRWKVAWTGGVATGH